MLAAQKIHNTSNVVQLRPRATVEEEPAAEIMAQLYALIARLEAGAPIGLAVVVLEADGNHITVGSGVFCSDSSRGYEATKLLNKKFA